MAILHVETKNMIGCAHGCRCLNEVEGINMLLIIRNVCILNCTVLVTQMSLSKHQSFENKRFCLTLEVYIIINVISSF